MAVFFFLGGLVIQRPARAHGSPQAQADGTPTHIIEFLERRALRTCPLGLAVMAGHLLDCPDRTVELAERAASFPILVSYGENDDAWPPDVQEEMAKRLSAEHAVIADSVHSPACEQPEAFVAALVAFWQA